MTRIVDDAPRADRRPSTVVALTHALLPKIGIVVSNVLGGFKLVILLVIVCSGFAALSGRLQVPRPDNFSTFRGKGAACELPPHVESAAAANYAIALLQVGTAVRSTWLLG